MQLAGSDSPGNHDSGAESRAGGGTSQNNPLYSNIHDNMWLQTMCSVHQKHAYQTVNMYMSLLTPEYPFFILYLLLDVCVASDLTF